MEIRGQKAPDNIQVAARKKLKPRNEAVGFLKKWFSSNKDKSKQLYADGTDGKLVTKKKDKKQFNKHSRSNASERARRDNS
jgi:hypothetical protein